MDGYDSASIAHPTSTNILLQSQRVRAEGVELADGEEADERIHDRMLPLLKMRTRAR